MSGTMSSPVTAESAFPGAFARNNRSAARADLASENPINQLVRRSQAGDVAAFEELFNQFQRTIYNVVYQMLRNEADAADVTQKVFIRVYKSLPRLKSPEAFVSWLHRIALNMTRNYIRDTTRVRVESLDRPYAGEEENNTREIADDSQDPAAHAEVEEVRAHVHEALQGLSEDHRLVVTLHHLEGHSVEEIGQLMGCSVGTIKSRLSRARAHLKRSLIPFVEGA